MPTELTAIDDTRPSLAPRKRLGHHACDLATSAVALVLVEIEVLVDCAITVVVDFIAHLFAERHAPVRNDPIEAIGLGLGTAIGCLTAVAETERIHIATRRTDDDENDSKRPHGPPATHRPSHEKQQP